MREDTYTADEIRKWLMRVRKWCKKNADPYEPGGYDSLLAQQFDGLIDDLKDAR